MSASNRAKGVTAAGVAGIILSVIAYKGCVVDVACLGCINVTPEYAEGIGVVKDKKPHKEGTLPPLGTGNDGESIKKTQEGGFIDCSQIVITPPAHPPKMNIRTKEEVNDPNLMVKLMALHIASQRRYMAEYEREVTDKVREFNSYCN